MLSLSYAGVRIGGSLHNLPNHFVTFDYALIRFGSEDVARYVRTSSHPWYSWTVEKGYDAMCGEIRSVTINIAEAKLAFASNHF